MLQCEAAMAAAGAALRLRLLYRMLRVGELLALVAFVSWSSSYVPSAVAAALRVAGSLLLNARFVFVLGNAIVLLLFALSRHDVDLSSSSSNDEQRQPAASTATTTATTPQQASSSSSVRPVATPVSASSFPAFATLAADPLQPPVRDEAAAVPASEPDPVPRATALFEEDKQQQPAVRVVVNKARAPRRSRSEKMGLRLVAASPELRRCESENGRRRRRSSVSTAEACWGLEDADEFRRQVEAFIARQTRFHREESMTAGAAGHCGAAPAFTGALAVVE